MIQVNAVTENGGAVELNKDHGVWASYAVATAGDLPPSEILYANATLKDGRCVQFFLNRETGLIVVDLVAKKGNSGIELLRATV